MKDDNILDSGEIYKDPEQGSLEYLPELELETDKFDPVSWEPARAGGASFKTHKMVFPNDDSIKFVGTFGSYLFGAIFFVSGITALVLGFMDFHLLSIIIGFMFTVVGLFLIDYYSIPVFFNKRVGLYWKGRQSIFQRLFTGKEGFSVKLEDIKAIQVIEEHIIDEDGSYNSYEINLVLTNNKRLNVVDHGNKKSAMDDAAHLAEFLGVPFLYDKERLNYIRF